MSKEGGTDEKESGVGGRWQDDCSGGITGDYGKEAIIGRPGKDRRERKAVWLPDDGPKGLRAVDETEGQRVCGS